MCVRGRSWLWVAAATFAFFTGFSGTYLLMDNQGLNFFLILAGVLGMNTLMLAVWLATLFLRVKVGRFFSSPATWFRGKDPVNQAVLRLYADEWRQPSVRWKIGATSHSLWLCTLLGMLVSVLLLLLVRQYTFNWESTLLGDSSSVRLVEMLAWLPAKLGFPVPDARAVIEGRLNGNIADARAWSGLLVGSIACYGILPRFLAWVVCKILLKTSKNGLDLEKTYYQAVIRRWQNKITDADTRRETVSAVSPKIVLNDAPKWAVMLETEWQDGAWFEGRLAQEWLDKGVAANREQVAALEAELKQKWRNCLSACAPKPSPTAACCGRLCGFRKRRRAARWCSFWRNRGFQTTFRKSWNIGVTRWPNAARRGLSLTGRRRKGV